MQVIDRQYTRTPLCGIWRMTVYLNRLGCTVETCATADEADGPGGCGSWASDHLASAGTHTVYPSLLRGAVMFSLTG